MKDSFKRIICRDLNLRAYTVNTTQTAHSIIKNQEMSPNAIYAVAESVTATALLTSLLKPDSNQRLALKIAGSGPIESIYIQAECNGALRGCAKNPMPDLEEEISSIDFSKTIGAGVITLNRDIGMKEPYSGISPIIYGSVAEDIAYYLTTSEQVPSAMIIATDTDAEGDITIAGGILIQTFPDTPDESIAMVENAVKNEESLRDHLRAGGTAESYLSKILDGAALEELSGHELFYQCSCARDIILQNLTALSVEDLKVMQEEDNGAEVTCTFCNSVYTFTVEDLEEIIALKHGTH